MVSLNQISKSFRTKRGERQILSDITFDLPAGSFTTLFGPNGSGKSTLINLITGIDRPTSGTILGQSEIKRRIGYVFQDYRRSLLPWANVKENIFFPLKLRRLGLKECEARLSKLLETAAIDLDLKQNVGTLSGGQAQMVSILRSLIIDPKLLILDEPFAALDYERTLHLRSEISKLTSALKLTVLFISHDLEEAVLLGDRVVFFSQSPTKIVSILNVNLPRPRMNELVVTPEFLGFKQQAFNIFQQSMS